MSYGQKHRIDPRLYYQGQPGCSNALFQILGVNALVYAPTGTYNDLLVLFQEHAGGFYSAIGGACDLFVDDSKSFVRFETTEETLVREFLEETGVALLERPGTWHYLDTVISPIHYECYPSVHGIGVYHSIRTTPERIQHYASGGGSPEGKIVVLNTEQVLQAFKDNKISPNTKPALRKFLQEYCLLPPE